MGGSGLVRSQPSIQIGKVIPRNVRTAQQKARMRAFVLVAWLHGGLASKASKFEQLPEDLLRNVLIPHLESGADLAALQTISKFMQQVVSPFRDISTYCRVNGTSLWPRLVISTADLIKPGDMAACRDQLVSHSFLYAATAIEVRWTNTTLGVGDLLGGVSLLAPLHFTIDKPVFDPWLFNETLATATGRVWF